MSSREAGPAGSGRASAVGSSVLATPPHLMTATIVAVGAWLLWPGSNWIQKLIGVGLLAIAWVTRPTAPAGEALSPASGHVERYVRGAVRILRRWEELLSPYRPDFRISSEHQVLLDTSGGRSVLSHNAQSGLVADAASLMLLPFRALASAYRRMLERRLPEQPDALDPPRSARP